MGYDIIDGFLNGALIAKIIWYSSKMERVDGMFPELS